MRVTEPVDGPTVKVGVINNKQKKSFNYCASSGCGVSGKILARTCMTSLMMKKWQDCYWVHELPAKLLVFRSEKDFHQYSQEQKKKYLKLAVDFDTLGLLQQEQEYKSKSKSGANSTKVSAATPKLVSAVQKYALADVHTKLYGKQALHSFKLQRLTGVGVDTVGAFASENVEEIKILRRVIHECIKITSKSSSRQRRKQSASMISDDQTQEMTVSDVYSLSVDSNYLSYPQMPSKYSHRRHR